MHSIAVLQQRRIRWITRELCLVLLIIYHLTQVGHAISPRQPGDIRHSLPCRLATIFRLCTDFVGGDGFSSIAQHSCAVEQSLGFLTVQRLGFPLLAAGKLLIVPHLRNRHFVLGEGASLVRTNDRTGSKRFHTVNALHQHRVKFRVGIAGARNVKVNKFRTDKNDECDKNIFASYGY